MSKRDFYDTLGVNRDANDDEIKKAYRKMAMKHHPDRNPDSKEAEAKFKEAKEAYEILSDGQKRATYDQFGHAGVDQNAGMGGFGGGRGNANGFGDFGDIFSDIFGGGRGQAQRRPERGADLRYNLEITLEEAARGCEKEIRFPTHENCDHCDGTGAKPGTQIKTCTTCGGHGQVRMSQGFFAVQQTCPTCQGTGKKIESPCLYCGGAGQKKSTKTLKVKIPAGIDTGDRMRVSGEGEVGERGGSAGDLYVVTHVKEHAVFQRDGRDLHCEMPISFATAALGGDLEIPTLEGLVKVKVAAETQTGRIYRVKGKGIRSTRSSECGDLMCHVVVETPVKLTEEQKDLLRQFEAINKEHEVEQNPKATSFVDKLKSFFN